MPSCKFGRCASCTWSCYWVLLQGMVDGQLFLESLLSFYKGNRSLILCLSFALLHIWKHWIPFATDVSDQPTSVSRSSCISWWSFSLCIGLYITQSSANNLAVEWRLSAMSLMNTRNKVGPSTVPWRIPDVMSGTVNSRKFRLGKFM